MPGAYARTATQALTNATTPYAIKLANLGLDEALRQCAEWSAAGQDLDVAVNLSALDLRDPGLVGRVERALGEAAVNADRLWVEVTETSVMSEPQEAMNVLTELRELGVRVAIDDFGVGQSSLSYIRRLPATDVKIDKSFVRDVATQPRDAAIVRAAIALAHELGLSVTAEGVETAEALTLLRQLGCDHAQGYFIARPMPADEVLRWMQEELPELRPHARPARARVLAAAVVATRASLP